MTFCAGNAVNMTDYNIWPFLERLDLLDADEYANLRPWQERMYTLPAVTATAFSHELHMMFAQQLQAREAKGYIDYDFDLNNNPKSRL